MIQFYDQVPSIYTNASRDFQYLSWLINIVLNSVKHNVDDIYDLPNTKADPRLTELLAMTLGFKVKRNYDQKQLATLVSIIPSILKYKGTEKAIRMAGEALITASGTRASFDCEMSGNMLKVILPKDLVDTTLFVDLLPYISPAGITCRIVRKNQIQETLKTEVGYDDVLQAKWYKDLSWSDETNDLYGLAGLFEPGSKPILANYSNKPGEPHILNTGLLSNTIIPMLDSSIYGPTADIDFTENSSPATTDEGSTESSATTTMD